MNSTYKSAIPSSTTLDDDTQLVARVLNNKDQQAFTMLVLRHQQLVRSLLLRSCRQDVHLVDDLLQEIFMRAYLSLASFRAEAKFSTWLYRIALNLLMDKNRRKQLVLCDLDSIEDFAGQCRYLQQSDLRGDLSKAMNRISDAQKIAVRLCLQEGFTHADAAEVMNMPLGTVKSHVARGRASLQILLEHWCEVA